MEDQEVSLASPVIKERIKKLFSDNRKFLKSLLPLFSNPTLIKRINKNTGSYRLIAELLDLIFDETSYKNFYDANEHFTVDAGLLLTNQLKKYGFSTQEISEFTHITSRIGRAQAGFTTEKENDIKTSHNHVLIKSGDKVLYNNSPLSLHSEMPLFPDIMDLVKQVDNVKQVLIIENEEAFYHFSDNKFSSDEATQKFLENLPWTISILRTVPPKKEQNMLQIAPYIYDFLDLLVKKLPNIDIYGAPDPDPEGISWIQAVQKHLEETTFYQGKCLIFLPDPVYVTIDTLKHNGQNLDVSQEIKISKFERIALEQENTPIGQLAKVQLKTRKVLMQEYLLHSKNTIPIKVFNLEK